MGAPALAHLKSHLKGKVVIVGVGNTLRSDDGIGSLLAGRIKDKVPYIVYDAGESPENYLGKIIGDKPDNIVLIDAVDFGGRPGELRELDAGMLKTVNLFSTHNAGLSLAINYLQNNLLVDIIILMVQPGNIALGQELSPQVTKTLGVLEDWFNDAAKKEEG